jgi:hypothetical protein
VLRLTIPSSEDLLLPIAIAKSSCFGEAGGFLDGAELLTKFAECFNGIGLTADFLLSGSSSIAEISEVGDF